MAQFVLKLAHLVISMEPTSLLVKVSSYGLSPTTIMATPKTSSLDNQETTIILRFIHFRLELFGYNKCALFFAITLQLTCIQTVIN